MVEHWNPVSERLPDSSQKVIVCRKDRRVEQGVYLGVNGWWKVYGTNTKAVTHWMPMPEPPNEIPSKVDMIRRMDDPELAKYLYSLANRDFELQFCQNKRECQELVDSDGGVPEENCLMCLLHYLQQPGIAGNNT